MPHETYVKVTIHLAMLTCLLIPTSVPAGPSAEVARRCMRYAYVAYPYHRPGAVRMSGERQAYFKNCMEQVGNVPVPEQPMSAQGKS